MSLLAYAFGGGLAGVGEGLTKVGEHEQRMKGERLREAYWKKMEMARQGFQSGEAEKGRTFQTGEAEKGRTFQTGEAEKGRTFQESENAAKRAAQGQKDKQARRADAKETAIKLSMEKDEFDQLVLNREIFGYGVFT